MSDLEDRLTMQCSACTEFWPPLELATIYFGWGTNVDRLCRQCWWVIVDAAFETLVGPVDSEST